GQVTFDGGDTAGLRHRNPTSSGVQVQIDEETSRDAETNHTNERIHTVAFDRPAIIEPYTPPPILDPEDLAGQLPGDPTTLEQSALVFNIGPGAREGLAALRFEETSTGTLGTDFNKLLELKTGGALDVRNTPSQDDAIGVIEESLKQVGRMRNRAGRFSKYVIDSAVRYQDSAVVELADASSQIRDTDYAAETGALTRQQIISQALTNVLGVIARTQRDNLLTLLG
ncbi:MAG: flagellin, partial [Planctomycetota bacterium]